MKALVLLLCLQLSVSLAQTPIVAPETLAPETLEPGTVVTLLPPDLVGTYATAVVGEDRRVAFGSSLEPETEVRVLILPPGVEATASPPYGRVSPSGDDIYIQFEGATQAVSLRYWLAEAYGVELVFAPTEGVP